MDQTNEDWHLRFRQQSGWTGQIRRYLLGQMNLSEDSRILEVGSGTGVITIALCGETPSQIFGLDLNKAFLHFAHDHNRQTHFCGGNALALPFASGMFDAVVSHFFLLWVEEPDQALAEMVRVVPTNGFIAAFAEPDYGGRIDYPPPLDELGHLQAEALRRQGAAPWQGRELTGLFHAAGLKDIETGVLGGQWQEPPSEFEIRTEWAVLEEDLSKTVSPARLAALRQVNETAWREGRRVLFVPTFYAIGRK